MLFFWKLWGLSKITVNHISQIAFGVVTTSTYSGLLVVFLYGLLFFFGQDTMQARKKMSYSCRSWGQTIRFLWLSRYPSVFWRSSATSSCRLAARRESCWWLCSHQSVWTHCSASTGTTTAQMAMSGLRGGQLYYRETGTSGKGRIWCILPLWSGYRFSKCAPHDGHNVAQLN